MLQLFRLLLLAAVFPICFTSLAGETPRALEWIRVSADGAHFVGDSSRQRFRVWGVNYDRDDAGRLLEDYWHAEWSTVEADFAEIKALGANCVRIHLQLGRFMDSAETPHAANLAQLAKVVKLAEDTGLYLDITGLGCYHKKDIPAWYDTLSESRRWEVQSLFWRAVAGACRNSPAVFCYNLMNEPLLPGANAKESDWLAGDLEGKHFVQRIALDLAGRAPKEVARDWIKQLTAAIRAVDDRHLITVGVIPWAQIFKGAKPVFYSPEASGPLDFVSVHFYPKKKDSPQDSLAALKAYAIGKPLIVEEIFPLETSAEEVLAFMDAANGLCDGWVSFYWGTTIEEYEQRGDMKGALIAAWLRKFRERGSRK